MLRTFPTVLAENTCCWTMKSLLKPTSQSAKSLFPTLPETASGALQVILSSDREINRLSTHTLDDGASVRRNRENSVRRPHHVSLLARDLNPHPFTLYHSHRPVPFAENRHS